MKPYADVVFYSLNELIDSFGDQNVQFSPFPDFHGYFFHQLPRVLIKNFG